MQAFRNERVTFTLDHRAGGGGRGAAVGHISSFTGIECAKVKPHPVRIANVGGRRVSLVLGVIREGLAKIVATIPIAVEEWLAGDQLPVFVVKPEGVERNLLLIFFAAFQVFAVGLLADLIGRVTRPRSEVDPAMRPPA